MSDKTQRMIYWASIIFIAVLLDGCASLGVQPWQRSVVAKPQMGWNYCQLTLAMDDHIYFSKEAMSGGRDFAGGGCGCN
jgi:hypothetical protein